MQWARNLADRLGISVWVIWVGLAALVVAIVIIVRRMQSNAASTATNAASSGQNDVLNGPFSSGIDGTTANQNPTSPDGGADSGTTPAPVQTAPILPPGPGGVNPPTSGGSSGTPSAAVYVHPAAWPAPTSTLSGLSKAYGTSLGTIESFPENQYIRTRSPRGFDLIYTSDTIRVR